MPLPTLSQLLAYPPGLPINASIHEVITALSQHSGTPCSHIIVVDEHRRPTGALSVKGLWAYALTATPNNTLSHLREKVEPIIQVEVHQSLETVWPLPLPDTVPPVVVDESTRYVGIICPSAVLSWLSQETSLDSVVRPDLPIEEQISPDQGANNWLLEVSHALKNPMTSLLGLSTLLLDPRLGNLNDRQTRYATLIQQVVRRLIGLINQLLDWMRLEAGQLSFDVQTIDVQPFLRQVFEGYQAQLSSAQTEMPWTQQFILDLPASPPTLKADPLRLQLSLHWLFDYLLHYQAEPAGLESDQWGPWVGVTLWTAGPPLEPSQALPEPTPPSPASHSSPQGTLDSLGFLLARRFCQHQGGDLTYWLSPGGNRITLLYPAGSMEDTEPIDDDATASTTATKTVLVLLVSRQGEEIDQVMYQLQASDYRIAVARSLTEAEGMIQRLKPKFVLSCSSSFSAALPTLRRSAGTLTPDQVPLWIELISSNEGKVPPEQGELRVRIDSLKETLDQFSETLPEAPEQLSLSALTLLLLPALGEGTMPNSSPGLTQEFRTWLQHYQCRLLQVDDLSQARVLSRVWQPDAILVDSPPVLTNQQWQDLAKYPELARLPFITLTASPAPPHAIENGLEVHSCPVLSHQSPQQMAVGLIQTIENVLKH
jgi:hypothetical protein